MYEELLDRTKAFQETHQHTAECAAEVKAQQQALVAAQLKLKKAEQAEEQAVAAIRNCVGMRVVAPMETSA